MKKILIIMLTIPVFNFSQFTNIPDKNFEQALIDLGCDDVIDGKVLTNKIDTIKWLDVSNKDISDLTGIHSFNSLTELYCAFNQLVSLDLSNNTALVDLRCHKNQLISLDVSKNTSLKFLVCDINSLENLDVNKNVNLELLSCAQNQLKYLNISGCSDLYELWCQNNSLTSLNLSKNTALKILDCSNNQFDCEALKAKYNIKN